ncbi:MAG: tagaturonate epimerase family protein, partial [Chloroflexota bacterium]|nr:tagaturonate epimerase family protein [Chloroflexota bacterium]
PGVAPVFAQQSIREMDRTERTPDQVLDDATWGLFQEGWRAGFGADADHLKTTADADVCVDAGYTMYTVDPGDHVDDGAVTAGVSELIRRVESLPWDVLESSPGALRTAYLDKTFDLDDGGAIRFSEETLLRAAAKYGRAVAHAATMYRHLAGRLGDPGAGQGFELEVSVDETETPTTPEEHFFVASELRRLSVRWVSLAPRFVGRFEKGVDYIGDLQRFDAEFARHVAIARALGPYKLSVHSGSDKFSIYPIVARLAGDLVHLKTAGTSYLEALRAIISVDPALFREILAFARRRYSVDRVTYHVSADPTRVPLPDQLSDSELAGVLDDFDGRQVLHITFGSVMTAKDAGGDHRFRERLLRALRADEEVYYSLLETHLGRHIAPFV